MTAPETRDPIIEIRDVVKQFHVGDGDVTILKNVSLEIGSGEFVAIVGPSGSGKSTLLNMITGIDRPSAGEVVVLGKPIHTLSENQLARWRGEHVGIIFQFFQLLPALTLLKNVILPMDLAGKYKPRERRTRALQLLEMVGLADQAHKLPGMVSGGQQQRAAIVRALANDPPLLVADEPTGNLDQEAAHRIFDLFHQLVADGKAMVVVTHDKDLAHTLPRQVEIADGQIVADHRQEI
ncbi:MAG: ABC transporter ATP-binding protein [Anaerolineales bacterium]|nr:ABC transporter ATP-binding protein [Anaerolineales bacterium]